MTDGSSSRPITVVIVDDEPLARTAIREQLKQWPDMQVVAEAADGPAAVALVREKTPDLLFLDVRMPTFDGFEVIERIAAEWLPVVVFVTAYDEYALKAFEANATDYLVKPFSVTRFRSTIDRARAWLMRGADDEAHPRHMIALLDDRDGHRAGDLSGRRFVTRFAVQSRGRIVLIKAMDVDWFEAAANYVTLHTGSHSYLIRSTMTQLEQDLDPERFVRIHRATIVQIDRIKEIVPKWHDFRVTLCDGTVRNMSRNYSDRLFSTRRATKKTDG